VSGLPGERGSDAASTAARLAGAGGPVYPCASVVEAWGRACADSAPEDRVVGVGSFITAGDIIGSLDAASAA
jgi:folylpolyglutamate synthase/dihydropteroate synthase